MIKTAVIYARVSDRKQVDRDVSLPSQLEETRKRAALLGASVVREFVEEGRSGWHGVRPEFDQAIEFCESHQVDYFITWDTARFSRNSLDGPMARYRLRKSGTRIEYIAVSIDPDTDEGFVLETIFQMSDELKSRMTSADTTRSMLRNARAGYFNGGRAPYGYQVAPAPDDSKRRVLIVNEAEAEIVRQVFAMRLDGLGAGSIAGLLRDDGFTNRGRPWNKASVASLLRNQTVMGNKVYGRKHRHTGRVRDPSEWTVVKNAQPIVDTETWSAVQRLMDAATNTDLTGSPKSTHAFTGLLRCGYCGASFQIETAKGRSRRYSYYNCRSAQKHGQCRKRRIRADILDLWLGGMIMDRILSEETVSELTADWNNATDKWDEAEHRRLRRLEMERGDRLEKRERLLQIIEASPEHAVDLLPRIRDHGARIDQIDRLVAEATAMKPEQICWGQDGIELFAREMRDEFLQLSGQDQRKFFQSFIRRIDLHRDHVRLEYKPEMLLSSAPVHNGGVWLPETGLLGTRSLSVALPDWACAAA